MNLSFWELLVLLGTVAAITTVGFGFYARRNSKDLREMLVGMDRSTREMLAGMDRSTKEMLVGMDKSTKEMLTGMEKSIKEMLTGLEARMVEESRLTREILIRIEQNQTETRREMAEAFKKMDETLKSIAQLIVSESEKTRQAIKGYS